MMLMLIPLVLSMILLMFQGMASAETVTIIWNANTESDLKGYKVYRDLGACSAEGTTLPLVVLGKVTSYTDGLIPAGTTLVCYRLSAIDTSDNESVGNPTALKSFAPVPVSTVTLTVLGNPATEPWGVQITSSAAEPFDTEVWLNDKFDHRESFAPRCLTEVANVCSKLLRSAGTYVVEARIFKNNIEVVRKSITVVVPVVINVPPLAPTGLKTQ